VKNGRTFHCNLNPSAFSSAVTIRSRIFSSVPFSGSSSVLKLRAVCVVHTDVGNRNDAFRGRFVSFASTVANWRSSPAAVYW
jgi:hypothetical protein